MLRLSSAVSRVLALCVGLSIGPACFAQAVSGSINGYVTDATGAVIAGCKVSIVNEATGVPAETTTTSEGFYTATGLLPGMYSITAERPGFSKLTREHVKLGVDAVAMYLNR
jgi:hypothetical protein